MADLLGGGAEGIEVAPVEEDPGVPLGEQRAHARIEHHAERYLVAVLGDEGTAAVAGIAARVLRGEEEIGDRRFRLQRVQRLEPALHVHEQAGDAHCGRPSPGSTGAIPRSASSAAARRLPVWTQRS